MGAVLQLERFDRMEPQPAGAMYSAEELQDAYAQGMIAGREQAGSEQAMQLRAALAAVAGQIEAHGAAIAGAGRDQARSLAPLIGALLEGALPVLARARLESALLSVMVQLAETVTPLALSIRCGADMAPFLAACIAEAGIADVTIAADGPPGTVTADLLGGVMSWDEAAVAAQLRGLVQEIMEQH